MTPAIATTDEQQDRRDVEDVGVVDPGDQIGLIELVERLLQEQRAHHDQPDDRDDHADKRGEHRLHQERQLGVPAARTDQSHDADLGSAGVRRDLNHVGYQQDCADRLHQRHRERGVTDPVEHGEEPVDQVLLVQHVEHAGLADHRLVEILVLLGIVQLDDERRRERLLDRRRPCTAGTS